MQSDILNKVAAEMRTTGEVNAQGAATKISKFFQKLFKKVLTKKKRCAILPELPPRGGGENGP